MSQINLSLVCRSLTWLSEAACLTPGSIQRGLSQEQIARLGALLLPEGQAGDRVHGCSASPVAEGDLLRR